MIFRGMYFATPDTAVTGSSVPILTDPTGRLRVLATPTTNDGVAITSANPMSVQMTDSNDTRRMQEEILFVLNDIRELLRSR